VGWQDRDWARLTEAEKDSLYGVPPAASRSNRLVVWGAVALLAALVGGFAYSQGPKPAALAASSDPAPIVIYGHRGTAVGGYRTGPGGPDTVCTREGIDMSGRWSCLQWTINLRNLPVVEPPPYQGPCADAVADQKLGRWMCARGTAPPPEPAPAVPVEPSATA
jgi:hypothetical protein